VVLLPLPGPGWVVIFAGMAVWAAAVPSGLAYAGLAGLPPIVGLYASAVAGLAYGLAGSLRQAQVGPTSTSSILTAAAIAPMAHGDVARATELAAVLALEVAAIMLLAWAFRLGFLADLLSQPVLVGFTAAMSLVIIAAQLPNLFGVSGVTTRTFQTTIGGLGRRVDVIDAASVAIGVGALVALLAMRRLRPRWPRELLVVGAATLLVAVLGLQDVRTGRLQGFSLEVHAGEIVGVAGVEGNGQREIADAIMGLRSLDSGVILLRGRDLAGLDPEERRDAGVGFVPEDRHGQGLVLDMTLWENSVLGRHDDPEFSRGGVLFIRKMKHLAERLLVEFDVRARSIT